MTDDRTMPSSAPEPAPGDLPLDGSVAAASGPVDGARAGDAAEDASLVESTSDPNGEPTSKTPDKRPPQRLRTRHKAAPLNKRAVRVKASSDKRRTRGAKAATTKATRSLESAGTTDECEFLGTVFIVEDDAKMRESLQWLLESDGFQTETFTSGEDFLARHDPNQAGCVVLDVWMPGLSGLQVQAALSAWEVPPPIIFLTAYGEVPTAVRALRAGALHFLEKPFIASELLAQVRIGLKKDRGQRQTWTSLSNLRTRLALLSPREREVLDQVVAGKNNREIADHFHVSHRTIENQRASILQKLQVGTSLELVRSLLLLRSTFGDART